jgi:hypothetical protein
MKCFYSLFFCLYAAITAAQPPIILLSKSSGGPEARQLPSWIFADEIIVR